MKRDVVAPVRKAKIPIPAAPINRDLRQATGNSNLDTEGNALAVAVHGPVSEHALIL